MNRKGVSRKAAEKMIYKSDSEIENNILRFPLGWV